MAAEAEAAREARAKVSERATWDDPGVASVTELQKKTQFARDNLDKSAIGIIWYPLIRENT